MVAHCFNGLLFEAKGCDLWRSVRGHSEHPHLQVACLVSHHIKYQSLQLVSTENAPSHSFNNHENRANLTYPLYIPIIPYSLFPAIFTKYIHFTSQTSVLSKYYLRNSSSFKLRVNMVLHSLSLPLNFSFVEKQPISALTSLAWLLPTIIIRDDKQIQYPKQSIWLICADNYNADIYGNNHCCSSYSQLHQIVQLGNFAFRSE